MKTLLILVAGFFLTTLPALRAGTLEFPKDSPTFRVTLPGGWRTNTEEDGTIQFAKDENSPLVISISRKTNAHSDDEINVPGEIGEPDGRDGETEGRESQ
jgi:hypothetical protein